MQGPLARASTDSTLRRRIVLSQAGFVAFASAIGAQGDELLQLYSLQALRLSPQEIGVALGLLLLAVPMELLGAYYARAKGKIVVLRVGFGARLIFVSLLLLVPTALGLHREFGYAVFVVILLAANIAHVASFNVAWPMLMKEVAPPEARGRFISKVRMINQLTSVIFLASIGALAAGGFNKWIYYLIVMSMCLYCANASWQVSFFVENGKQPARHGSAIQDVIHDLHDLLSARFFAFLLAVILMRLSFFPLATAYGKRVVELSDALASVAIAGSTAAAIVALLAWGRLVDQIGPARAAQWSTAAIALCLATWIAASAWWPPADIKVVFIAMMIVASASSAGQSLALFTACFDRVGGGSAPIGFALFSMCISLGAYPLQMISGLTLEAIGRGHAGSAAYSYLLSCAAIAGMLGIACMRHLARGIFIRGGIGLWIRRARKRVAQ